MNRNSIYKIFIIAIFTVYVPFVCSHAIDVKSTTLNFQVNEIYPINNSYIVGTSKGVYILSTSYQIQRKYTSPGFVTGLVNTNNDFFIGSEVGLFKYSNEVLQKIQFRLNEHKNIYIRTLSFIKIGQSDNILFSATYASTETVEPLGLFLYNISEDQYKKLNITNLKNADCTNITAINTSINQIMVGTDDDYCNPGEIYYLDIKTVSINKLSGQKYETGFDHPRIRGSVSVLVNEKNRLLVGFYYGKATGANIFGVLENKKWHYPIKSNADRIHGISSIAKYKKFYILSTYKPDSADTVIYILKDNYKITPIILSEVPEILNLKIYGDTLFLCTRRGLKYLNIQNIVGKI